MKIGGAATIATFALGIVPEVKGASIKDLPKRGRILNYTYIGRKTPSICPYCAGGCGLLVTWISGGSAEMREGDIYAKNLERDLSARGRVVEIEGDPYSPINEGALCSKPSALLQVVNSTQRVLLPMKRTNPNKGENEDPRWVFISWEEAYSIIASKVKEALTNFPYKRTNTTTGKDDYYYIGKDSPVAWLGSSYWNNEECYLGRKFMALLGSNNIEHQARKCHASTVVALANTFGFGAMTNHIVDAKNSKCFLIMSNPAESHSMEFRWVTRAKENNNAKIIVLDPRYHRSAAKADIYVRYRSGAEAAIFLGLIRYLLYEKPERIDRTFVENRTNAPYDLNGNLVGLDDPNSILNRLKALVDKYDPEVVYKITGIPVDKFLLVADTFTDPNNRPGNIYYAMGTTQHTNAVQAIRAHAILQLLLGNMGVPGGGVNALRGISNVQGSTDMSELMEQMMGYREPPRTIKWYTPISAGLITKTFEQIIRNYQKWKNFDPVKRGGSYDPAAVKANDDDPSYNKFEQRYYNRHFPTWNALEYHWGIYVGTWPGLDPDNEPIVCDLPVNPGNPIVKLFRKMLNGEIKVLICNAENPAVSMPNADLVRKALANPDDPDKRPFLVVNENFETETAWYADILLPGSTQVERSGSITNTGRWIQWRWKAIDPPGECKEDLIYITELFERIRLELKKAGIKLPSEKYGEENGVTVKRIIGGVDLPTNPEAAWPSKFGRNAESVYKEMGAKSITVGTTTLFQSAANVIYRNSYDPESRPDLDGIMPKRRDTRPVDAQDEQYGYFKNWAWSWMDNQRVLYNINETNPGVKTFFAWFAMNENVWLGLDKAAIWSNPLYDPTKPEKNPLREGMPLHNEPLESPDTDLANEYPTMWGTYYTYYEPVTTGTPEEYPYVLTTFRLAEHMQAGGMTRNQPWLIECQPEMFVEISPDLAEEIGVNTGEYVIVKTARKPEGERMKCIVTDRIQPLTINGKTVHEVSMPWHWGFRGLST
ncbi:MAG: molybdopterin-dependent oxidoreductase, partial [archaeon]|nr:molybdopterin-dependent oxidoreductase [archaeon]